MEGVPAGIVQTAVAIYGEAGAAWARSVPDAVAALAGEWGLTVSPPFPGLSYNVVLPVETADGRRAVLKVCLPGHEFATEAAALRLFGGRGMARLLRADAARRALLLERVEPGTPIAALDDDAAATGAAASVLRALRCPAPEGDHPFPTVADWGRAFDRLRARFGGGGGPLPVDLVDRGERLYRDLTASSGAPQLLHGDLHHGNVLAGARAPWLRIDPKGVIGEAAFDTASLFFNPAGVLDRPNPGRLLARRVDQLAEELDLPRERVRGWGIAKAVLSAAWTVEDNGSGWDEALGCARLLAAIR